MGLSIGDLKWSATPAGTLRDALLKACAEVDRLRSVHAEIMADVEATYKRLRADLERVTRERDEAKAQRDANAESIRFIKEDRDEQKRLVEGLRESGDLRLQEILSRDRTIARLTADLAEARKDGERLDAYVKLCEVLDANTPYWDCESQSWLIPYQVTGDLGGIGTRKYATFRAAIAAARDAGKGAKL